MKASHGEAEGIVPIHYQALWLYPLPFPADLTVHQPGERPQRVHVLLHGGLGYKGESFPHEDSQALEKVVKGGCAVSMLGGF